MHPSATLQAAVAPAVPRPRLEFIDNLRWAMIVLVVSMHAAVTYSHLGSWYFMEDPKPGTLVTAVFATYQIYLQAFFMGLLFFIAGYFVPAAFARKGWSVFLRDRAVRLGLPTLVFMVVVQPFTVYWLLRTFANPEISSLSQAYLPYLWTGRFLSGSGPMWFAFALLVFCVVYALTRSANRTCVIESQAALPGHFQVLLFALAIGMCSFLVRVIQPIGTNVLNMQLCFFSQYIALFVAGIYAWHRNWLLQIPYRFGMRWLALALSLGTFLWLALLYSLLKTHTESKLGGGFTWQSAAFSFWEAFFCVGVCLGVIVWFREHFNHQGRMCRWLSDNSFSVYMFHTPILIAVTFLLRGFEAPKLVKFSAATILGVGVSFLCSSLIFRRIPFLKRIL